MGFILGIDQGGSKTLVAIADYGGRIHAVGRSGGACHSYVGLERAMKMIGLACNEALAGAKLDRGDLDLVVAGIAGADWPHEVTFLENAVKNEVQANKVLVVNDCIVAMRAGSDQPYGAVLCAGTELNCAVRDKQGREFVFGYYIHSEDRGGSALAHQGLRAVFDAFCGLGKATSLTDSVLELFGDGNVDSLLRRYATNKFGVPIHRLTQIVVEAANGGDRVALDLLRDFGFRIGRYVVAGLERLDLLMEEVDVVLTGGLFKANSLILQDSVISSIRRCAPQARPINAVYEPIIGSLLIGLDRYYNGLIEESVKNKLSYHSRILNLLR